LVHLAIFWSNASLGSLIYLNQKSITSLALEAGVDPTNLSRFLKGHSTVSEEKMKKVLEHLRKVKEAGLKPEEAAKRLGLSE
jgi:DNA-binding LacI/PurR family transcriptional regulator